MNIRTILTISASITLIAALLPLESTQILINPQRISLSKGNINCLNGNLTVFDQNYSAEGIPDNIFAADPLETNQVSNYTLNYNSTRKAIEFYTWTGNTYSLFVGRLYPAVQTTYYMIFTFERDDQYNNIYIKSAIFYITVQTYNNGTSLIRSWYENKTGNLLNKVIYFSTPPIFKICIQYNGLNKTNHIRLFNSSIGVWTPAYPYDLQKLPYEATSNTYIQLVNHISSTGEYIKLYLYSIKQVIPKYEIITAIPRNNLQPLGFDGPHPYNTVHNGMEYLKSDGYRATLFFDNGSVYQWTNNITVRNYYKNLIYNYSWEAGIHFHEKLSTLSITKAEEDMNNEYNIVKNDFGLPPTTWCSLADADNVTHAQYAYNHLNMYWRNGAEGINAIVNVGGLNDNTWQFWNIASQHGFVYPTFVHETDLQPAELTDSIDWNNFTTWVDRAKQHGIEIVPFIDYFKINKNQVDFYATNIERGNDYIKFTAHTNGYKAWVDVNYTPDNYTMVKDITTGKYINWTMANKNIQFWVEDNHTYYIYERSSIPELGDYLPLVLTSLLIIIAISAIIINWLFTHYKIHKQRDSKK